MYRRNSMISIKIQYIYIALFIFMFSIIFVINFVDFKHKIASNLISKTSENVSTKFLYDLMSNEMVMMKESNNDDFQMETSIETAVFTTITNIWPEDIRTFLGRELPGFSIFNTEIAVAGKGTDLTTLPIESAPPVEVLLKERELAKKETSNSKQEKTNTPSVKTGKTVAYIYHSHSWEAFMPLLKGVKNKDQAVSFNEKANVIGVGKKLQDELLERGIGTKHSETNISEELQKKNWNYTNSYTLSRELVQEVMASEKSINYLIDIHRDSQPRKITTININGKPYARLFFVVGKEHPNYEQNLQLAKQLNKMLEEKYPGISRGVFVKSKNEGNGVYNQDLSNKSMLLEFGGVENNSNELYRSIEAFADIFSEYYWNTQKKSGTGKF